MTAPYENRVHQRILEIAVTADESDDTLDATAVKFYRDRQSLVAGQGYVATFSDNGPAGSLEIELGEVLPPPTVIRLVSTFQA